MISVIICTYNRSEILRECIESVLKNQLIENEFELLVIDNNSYDNTEEIVSFFTNNLPNVRYVKEEEVGLSHARNRGIADAAGEIIAFIDDDVIVSPQYVQSIYSFFKENREEVCAGGKVIPVWNLEKPDWFAKEFASIIGETTYGETQRTLNYFEAPIGCNMIFRKEIFDRIGLFDPDLGIKGNKLLLGEENELCQRIRELGKNIYYLPEAYVHHKVHANKVKKEYVLNRLMLEGTFQAQWHYQTMSKPTLIMNLLIRVILLYCKDYPKSLLNKNSFLLKCKVNRRKTYFEKLCKYMFMSA